MFYNMVNDLEKIVKKCYSKSDLCKELGFNLNGTGFRKINDIIINNGLDISHFGKKSKLTIYNIIEKKCPVCNKSFETKEGHRDEKISIKTFLNFFKLFTYNIVQK